MISHGCEQLGNEITTCRPGSNTVEATCCICNISAIAAYDASDRVNDYFSTSNSKFKKGSEPAPIELDNFFKSLQIKYKAYEADNPNALQSAIQDINVREKKKIQYSISIPGHDYSVDFIVIALILSILILIAKNLRVHSWQVE